MRVIFLGFDSMRADFAIKFMKEGYMPNMLGLKNEGFYAEAIPTFPPLTPPGWITIACGAWPSTTGIEDFVLHRQGEFFDVAYNGTFSDFCKAETIWEVADKNQKKVILIKYPVSWPPKIKNGLQIDGAGGFGGTRCRFAITDSMLYTNVSSLKYSEYISLTKPNKWVNIPKYIRNIFEAELDIKDREGDLIKKYYLLAFKENKTQTEKIGLFKIKNFNKPLTFLSVKQWSEWIFDSFKTKEGLKKCAFKLKLLELNIPDRLLLYRTQLHQTEEFTYPKNLSIKLVKHAGPFLERTAARDFELGWIDLDTQMEIYQMHTDWICKTIDYLMRNYNFDLFMAQWHPIDYAQHIIWGAIDPEHPDYDPEKAHIYWNFLGEVYGLADKIVGTVLHHIKNDTIIIITADHGHDLLHTRILINNLLIKNGFINIYFDEKGQPKIDWAKTKAYAFGMLPQIFVNLKGRDPFGIIEPGPEYEKIRNEIIELLYSLKDPDTGRHVIKMAVKKEEMSALGLYGENVGDILYTTERGYMPVTSIYYGEPSWGNPLKKFYLPPKITKDMEVFERTRLFKMHTSEHVSCSPFSEAMKVPFLMIGDGVKKGIIRKTPIRLVDIAPTISYILRIPFPRNCEGSVILDAFENIGIR